MSRHHGIVKEFLDTKFGNVTKIEDLSNVKDIYHQLLGRKNELEHQLSVITTKVPTKIEGAIRLADTSLTEGEALIARKDVLVQKIHRSMEECQPVADELGGMVVQVKEIEKFVLYLQWLENIENLSGEVQRAILSDSLTNASRTFMQLLKANEFLTSQNSKCESLMRYLSDTILFWYRILKEKLSSELDGILKKISWPFILVPGPHSIPKSVPGPSGEKSSTKAGSSTANTSDLPADFERIFTNLLMIQLPDALQKKEASEKGPSDSGTLLPVQLLLRPLRKRFRYHFSGNRQTNSIAKPEWYLTQVLNWVGNHREFLEHTVQPILDKNGHKNVDILTMFTRGLLQLVCRKLSEDMPELLHNDDLFSHTIDEVLLFDRELRGSHDFSPRCFVNESPLNVFMHLECLQKWINVEKNCALDRLDTMLSSPEAWTSQYGEQAQDEDDMAVDGSIEDAKVPECAESFVTMLLTITDRYKHIPSSVYQLHFLELQLHLLDDFRIRLTQVLKRESSDEPLGCKHFAVLNAAHYVANVLREWSENLFFLELKHKRDEEGRGDASDVVPQSLLNLGERKMSGTADPVGAGTDDSVFDGMLKLYNRLYQEGLDHVASKVCTELEIKGRPYANDSWLTLPPKEEQLTLVVSRTACAMLLVLQERLHLLGQKLSSPLFSSCWHRITEKVDSYLFREVVIRNHFNVGGAAQLQFDMTRNLFPLFSSFTQKPENYFRRLKECCTLLNLQAGSAMLLSELLKESADLANEPTMASVKPEVALSDIGVTFLRPGNAAAILKLRVDWPQNM